jgi:ABC-2 type transport system permease protein
MNDLQNMAWIELRKAIRSKMPLWTALGSLFLPIAVGLLVLLAKNPQLSGKLGLLGTKSNLLAYSATDWPSYLVLSREMLSAGGFFLFIIAVSWIFGREFADGTLKDLLAVPVERLSILAAKFIIAILWSVVISVLMLLFSLVIGLLIRLPGGTLPILLEGNIVGAATAGLVILVVLPFAFLASVGRGYILPLAASVLALIMANLSMVVGLAEYFPWSIPLYYAQTPNSLVGASYWIVFITSIAGMGATYLWWMYADQNR